MQVLEWCSPLKVTAKACDLEWIGKSVTVSVSVSEAMKTGNGNGNKRCEYSCHKAIHMNEREDDIISNQYVTLQWQMPTIAPITNTNHCNINLITLREMIF